MLRRRHGYSLVTWAVLFALVSASVIFFLSPVKRTLTSKTMKLTDMLLWGTWGSAVMQDGGRNYSQIGEAVTVSTQNQSSALHESKGVGQRGIINTTVSGRTDTTSSYSSY